MTSLHLCEPKCGGCLALLLNFFKEAALWNRDKAINMGLFSMICHACHWAILHPCCINGLLMVTYSYHPAKFVLKALASNVGKRTAIAAFSAYYYHSFLWKGALWKQKLYVPFRRVIHQQRPTCGWTPAHIWHLIPRVLSPGESWASE